VAVLICDCLVSEQLTKEAHLSWTWVRARFPESLTSTASSKKVLGNAISVDIGEEDRWLDGVASSTRSSEVVRNGDW